jgi:hypothetical protein
MQLKDFKGTVDNARKPVCGEEAQVPTKEALSASMAACFSPYEASRARSHAGAIVRELALRYLCDQVDPQPYLAVAEALQYGLHGGTAAAKTCDWDAALNVALLYAHHYALSWPLEQRWKGDARICTLVNSIRTLRDNGIRVELPDTGGVHLDDAEASRLASEIDRLAAAVGRAILTSTLYSIQGAFSIELRRFNLGRPGQAVVLDAQPQVPHAYLYGLGLRYIKNKPSADAEQMHGRLVDLTRAGIGLHEVVLSTFELINAGAADIIGILQKSLVFDSFFQLTQANPVHVLRFLEGILTSAPFSALKGNKPKTTSRDVLAVARRLLEVCQKAPPDKLILILPKGALDESGLLLDIFTHAKGANQKLTFPPKETDVDAAFRPLLPADGVLFMQPPSLAARAIMNAALDWCRRQWGASGIGKTFDEALGDVFEEYVRRELTSHSVPVKHGEYRDGAVSGECDAVVEADSAIVLFEMKGKVLNRTSRAGDDVQALADLADSVVRPQAQAMARQAFLKNHGCLELMTPTTTSRVEWVDREVFRVSITRGELWSLHDRPFLQRFLHAGCVSTFSTADPGRQSELDGLNKWFEKLRIEAAAADEPMDGPSAFKNSWSLSVFQLLLLLDRTSDANSFVRELSRTRRIATPTRDFYQEYVYKFGLDNPQS